MLKRLIRSKYLELLLAFWAFSESIYFFILPDFLLLPLIIFANRSERLKLFFTSIISSFLGALAMVVLCFILKEKLIEFLFSIPYTKESMLIKLENYSLLHSFMQAFSGIPAKLWLYWGIVVKKFNLFIFIYVSRTTRMFMIYLIGSFLSQRQIKKYIYKYWILFLVFYVSLFFYVMNIIG